MKTNEKVRPSRTVARSKKIHEHRQAHCKHAKSRNKLPVKYRRIKPSGKRSSAVALLSKSFINSINSAIRKIENNEFHPLITPVQSTDKLVKFEEVFGLFDIPELDDYEYDPFNFPETVAQALNQHFKCDDILVSVNPEDNVIISITELPTETDQPYFRVYDYSEISWYFEHGVGTYFLMIWTFLNDHGFINDYCAGQGEMYSDMAREDYEYNKDNNNYGKEDLSDMLHQARSIEVSQERFNRLNKYLATDIDLDCIADLMLSFEPENKKVKQLAQAFRDLQEFILNFEMFYEKYLDETNIYDLIVWFGNDDQRINYLEGYNECYGNDGTFIKFPHAESSERNLDEWMITWWNQARDQFKEFNIKPYKSLIDTYDKLLDTLTNAEIIEAFTGLCHKSEFVAAFHRELDRMQGCSASICGKWESIGVSTSFFELLKTAYRTDLGKQKGKLPGHASGITA